MASTETSTSGPNAPQNDIVKSGLKSMKWLFLLQLGSKLMTFVLNTAIARTVSQSSFAIANLQLQLLLNIVLPLSREAFRRAILRAPIDETNDSASKRTQSQRLLNLSYLSLPLGAVLSFILTAGFLLTSTSEELSTNGYIEAIKWTGAASMAEMLSEPLYIIAQHRLMFGTRAAVELVAVAIKSVLSYVMVVYLGLGLESFGIVAFVYSLFVSIGYWFYFGFLSPLPEFPTLRSLFPRRVVVKNADGKPKQLRWSESFDGELARFLVTFEWQTLQKMLLQEGEKFLLRGAENLATQSIFALVNVLGSLVVRFVFAWLEEGMFPLFSKILVQIKNLDTGKPEEAAQRRTLLKQANAILSLLCRLLTYIGLLFAAFGPSYSFLLLDLLYTKKYSQTAAPNFLAWFCVYILTMAVNGITEAFAHAAASPRELNWFNVAMIAQSAMLVAFALALSQAGVQAALIIASSISMLTRIFVSLGFIRRFFIDNLNAERGVFSLTRLFPNPIVVVIFIICHLVTRLSESYWCSSVTGTSLMGCAQHVGVGGICAAGVLGASVFVFERQYFRELATFIRRREI